MSAFDLSVIAIVLTFGGIVFLLGGISLGSKTGMRAAGYLIATGVCFGVEASVRLPR